MLSEEEKKIKKSEAHKKWRNSEKGKQWILKNRKKRLQFTRNWRERNRKYYLQLQRNYNRKNRMKIIEVLGGKCIKCGFSDWRALQIDHINGGGNREIKKMGTTNYYKYMLKNIKENPNKFQLLCANCNWIKRYEKNENPKQNFVESKA